MMQLKLLALSLCVASVCACEDTQLGNPPGDVDQLTLQNQQRESSTEFVRDIRVFATQDDPTVTPDRELCAEAPFTTTIALGASVWSLRTSSRTGKVRKLFHRRIGTGTACLYIPDLSFPVFTPAFVYGDFNLPGFRIKVDGQCVASSNDVPVPGIVLAGCTAKIVDGPEGVVGGSVISSSIFNPFGVTGFQTGSIWTVQTYNRPGRK